VTEPARKDVHVPGCTVGVLLAVPFWLVVAVIVATRWC
jgi:hypothetical protein